VVFAADAGAPVADRLCEFASDEPEEIRATAAAAFERDAAAAGRFVVLAAGALDEAVRAAAAAAKPDTLVGGGPLVRPELAKPVGVGALTFPGALRAGAVFADDPVAPAAAAEAARDAAERAAEAAWLTEAARFSAFTSCDELEAPWPSGACAPEAGAAPNAAYLPVVAVLAPGAAAGPC